MADPQEKLNRRLVKAAENGKVDEIEMYLIQGAEINAKGSSWQLGLTPVGSAAWMGHIRAVNFLIKKGANIEVRDGNGLSPLMQAVSMGHPDCAEALLKAGAKLDVKDTKGRTAFDLATRNRNPQLVKIVARYMQQAKAALEAKENPQMAPVAEAITAPPPVTEDPQVVILRQQAGDRLLEDIFNFAALERVTFVRKEPGAPVETMMRENFADMSNTSLLEKAYAEHVRRGGARTAAEIFPDAKPKMHLPGAGS